jgi:hypothetical protein
MYRHHQMSFLVLTHGPEDGEWNLAGSGLVLGPHSIKVMDAFYYCYPGLEIRAVCIVKAVRVEHPVKDILERVRGKILSIEFGVADSTLGVGRERQTIGREFE